MAKKILITGIDSFTGKHLKEYFLKEGYDVYGTSLFGSEQKVLKCDICKKEECIKIFEQVVPDFVVHLAAISFVGHGKDEDFYRVNTIGALNILESLKALKQKPQKILLVSSATVYGNQGVAVLDECLCPMPANHYGASKYALESLARNYFQTLPIIITRPFNYTGVGQQEHFLIPKIVSHFKAKNSQIELGNLDVIREFNDVSFVCEAYLRLLESEIAGEIFNIASSRGIALLDVIESMNKIAGYKIEVRVNPKFVRKDEIKSLTGSNEKLFAAIGSFEQKAFEDTLREMFEA
jgi:nucleoside-diphosphate-sugar epimerase